MASATQAQAEAQGPAQSQARAPAKQSERRTRTRARILDAAFAVFAREGYYGATLEAIVAEAGLSKGALYYSFDSKQALFRALLEERLAARADELLADAGRERPPAIAPERWALGAMDSMRLDRDWNLLFWEFACVAAREPETGRRFAEQLRSFRTEGADELRRMFDSAGISPAIPYGRLARIVAALANGLALDLMVPATENPDVEVRETMASALALLWRGVASTTREPGGDQDVG
jgi:AcrR family transcriptional regulator